MTGPAGRLNAEVIVEVMIENDQIEAREVINPVILLMQYANYVDIFNKSYKNILPEHTQHNLAIKTEDNKIFFFSPTYDHSKLKLKVLRDYINNILAKKFIRLFKSLSKALVFITKKNNRKLRLCVDF